MTSGPRSRVPTELPALDRVLGGGLVEGSTTLLAGRPGTGKSTLALQMLDGIGQRCLYVTGREPREQVVTRACRVGAMSNRIHVLAATRLEEILEQARSMRAQAIAIDTIQALICGHVKGRPGLRECMGRLIDYARTTGTTILLVSELTRRDDIASPKTIVHDVDVALRLDQEDDERILSCLSKNRFGPTSLVGRLKLTAEGFVEADEEAAPRRAVARERPIPGKEVSRQVMAEYTLVEQEPAGFNVVGFTFLETQCVGKCPRMYRIDPAHPSYAEVKAALDRGDRSVIFCYHRPLQ